MTQSEIDAQLDAADEPEVIEPGVPFSKPAPEPEVIEPGTTIAKPDGPPPWAHNTIEFLGDDLEVRKPTDQALTGFMLASSKYVPEKIKADIVGLFVKNHVSEESYLRIMERLLDPDDVDYTPATVGELMRIISTGGE